MFMQPRIILLKEGTDTSQGKPQLISNINAVSAVADIIKTTLGPRGMDKLIHDSKSVTISNDGATIVKLLDIVHPAAKTLTDIAKAQDVEVGDGTTTVVLLASEFLNSVKSYIEDGVHPQTIIRGFRLACSQALEKISSLAVEVDELKDPGKHRDMLIHCAGTALNSKLISGQKQFFAEMVVDAVLHLEDDLDLKMIGIKKVAGGSVSESFLVHGVAFKKTFSYAGFEQQPKSFAYPKIALLNVELELKSEKENAEVRLKDPDQYQQIVDAEWSIIYEKLRKIVASGAKIVLSRLPIGDLATQYFADHDVFCAGRVESDDLDRVAKATGGKIQTSLNDLNPSILGTCAKFEERQVGGERMNLFMECAQGKAATIVVRGGAEQFIEETERSLHDAVMIVKRARKHHAVVAGGGAIEMELSRYLREYAKSIKSKIQLIISAYAQALEIIPRQLSENAGFDSTDIVNELRAKHAQGGKWIGVDIENEGTCDTFKSFVWEPALLKLNAIASATEAACMVLSVDQTIKNPKSEGLNDDRPAPNPHAGRGKK
jgi:T-complex protein 1 subunit eta